MGSIGNYNAGYRARELEIQDDNLEQVRELVQKWRTEAEEKEKSQEFWFSLTRIFEINLLQTHANELEAIL
jgi:hypothetical protein